MTGSARARPLPPLVLIAICVCAIGLADGLLTKPGPWTAGLLRPIWHPPTWAFGPVWAVIGIFVTLGVAKAWEMLSPPAFKTFLVLAGINAALNVAWSALFFQAHRPDLALADIAALWLSIAACVGFLLRHGAGAAALRLSPYLAWVTIAAILNYEIVRLNAPF